MGLIPSEEVEDLILFKGLRATAGEFFDNHRWYAEEKLTVTIEDIVEKLGPRVPDHTASQKEFRILTLVLSERELTDQEWTYFSEQAKGFEHTFSWATGDRASAKVGDLDTFASNPIVDVGGEPDTDSETADFASNLTVTNSANEIEVQVFGLRPGFTDGLDAPDEEEMPPKPPTDVFDVRFQLAGSNGVATDIRQPRDDAQVI